MHFWNDDSPLVILNASSISGHPQTFFVGPFVKRVSFASQQHRALGLIHALFEKDKIKKGSKVAVIGAGLSGLMATAGLAAKGAKIYLFDRNSAPMERQHDAHHRFVHPSVNRWPWMDLNPTTRFPFLDWYETDCARIADIVTQEWKKYIRPRLIDEYFDCDIDSISQQGSLVKIVSSQEGQSFPLFDCVLVATGFGDEASHTDSLNQSYWVDGKIEQRIKNIEKEGEEIWITGVGDGGLIDTIQVLFSNFDNGRLIVDVANQLSSLKDDVRTLLENAEEKTSCEESYSKFLSDGMEKLSLEFPLAVTEDLLAKPRRIHVNLVAPMSCPYTQRAAPLHQLILAFCLRKGYVSFHPGKYVENGTNGSLNFLNGSTMGVEGVNLITRHGASDELERFLSPDEIVKLKQKQFMLGDYMVPWPSDAFKEHYIPGYPNCDTNSISFIAHRGKLAKEYLAEAGYDFKIVQEENGVAFSAIKNIGNNTEYKTIPNALFGVDTKMSEELDFDMFSNSIADSFKVSDDVKIKSSAKTPQGGKNEDFPEIAVNSSIYCEESSSAGRIGVLVRTADKRAILGISANHIFHSKSKTETLVYSSVSRLVVGRHNSSVTSDLYKDKTSLEGVGMPIETALSWFVVSNTTSIFVDPSAMEEIDFVHPTQILGEEVFIPNKSGAVGKVCAIDATVNMREQNSLQRTKLSGAVLIETANKNEFAVKGDSGSLVVDGNGRYVGLVIGGRNNKAVVAPLFDFVLRERFEFLSSPILSKWNKRARSFALPSVLYRKLSNCVNRISYSALNFLTNSENSEGRVRSSRNSISKRILDVVLAIGGLVLMHPFLIIIALLIKLNDGGPALFKQIRIGLDGKEFYSYKFRTMVMDSEEQLMSVLKNDPEAAAEWRKFKKLRRDPRITSLGRFLRKSSLDELPQLFNVLRGEMSVVGPRAISWAEMPDYGGVSDFAAYTSVRPGIIGLWSLSLRSGAAFEMRVKLDRQYIDNWSIWLDLKIIIVSAPTILLGSGVY